MANHVCAQQLHQSNGRVGVYYMMATKTTSVNTIKGFCCRWKGYAYQQIGSMYAQAFLIDEELTFRLQAVLLNSDYVWLDARILIHIF